MLQQKAQCDIGEILLGQCRQVQAPDMVAIEVEHVPGLLGARKRPPF
jgi:hypothetical protein